MGAFNCGDVGPGVAALPLNFAEITWLQGVGGSELGGSLYCFSSPYSLPRWDLQPQDVQEGLRLAEHAWRCTKTQIKAAAEEFEQPTRLNKLHAD